MCLILIFVLGACSSSKRVIPEFTTTPLLPSSNVSNLEDVTGTLNYSGNEPFAVPTIFVTDTLSYKLVGDEQFMKEEYKNLNGQRATLYGNILLKGSQKFFEVHFYKLQEN